MTDAAKKFGIPALAAVLAFALCLASPLYAFDMFVRDIAYSQLRPTLSDVIIVGVDERTLDAYGSFSSWSRDKTADLLDILYEDSASAPALVGLDINFQGQSDDASDEKLAQACAGDGRTVIVSGSLVYRGTVVNDESGASKYDAWNIEFVEHPYDALDAVVQTGFSNAYISPDGIVRDALPVVETSQGQAESFPYLLYRMRAEFLGQSASLPATSDAGLCEFFYAGTPGEFQHVSMLDVLEGSVPASAFAGKVVLVGAWASGMQDAYIPASDRGSTMYGVEVNANIMQAYADSATAVEGPSLPYAVVVAIVCGLLLFAVRGRGLALSVGSAVALGLASLGIGRLLATNGIVIPQAYALVMLALIAVYLVIEKYVVERIRRKRALAVFSQYIEPKVVESLSTEEASLVKLGGESRDVSVLFVDIRGFTTMSEGMQPEQVVEILNEYLALVTDCIFKHGGMLDKFVGDAAMAVFNAPFDQEDYYYESVATAWDIAQGSVELSERLMQRFGRTVSYGIGVNCGEAVVGNIGCDFRMDYTAIGDTVNTAARLESRAQKGQILISEKLRDKLEGRILTEEVGPMELKGKSQVINVYSVTGLIP